MTKKGVQMAPAFVVLDPHDLQRAIMLDCHFEGQDYPVIIPIRMLKPVISLATHALQVSSNVWRIRRHSYWDDDIKKAKTVIDQLMRHAAPNTQA